MSIDKAENAESIVGVQIGVYNEVEEIDEDLGAAAIHEVVNAKVAEFQSIFEDKLKSDGVSINNVYYVYQDTVTDITKSSEALKLSDITEDYDVEMIGLIFKYDCGTSASDEVFMNTSSDFSKDFYGFFNDVYNNGWKIGQYEDGEYASGVCDADTDDFLVKALNKFL